MNNPYTIGNPGQTFNFDAIPQQREKSKEPLVNGNVGSNNYINNQAAGS